MATTAFIALGSNLGDRRAYQERAVEALRGLSGVALTRLSSLYETAPAGRAPSTSTCCSTATSFARGPN